MFEEQAGFGELNKKDTSQGCDTATCLMPHQPCWGWGGVARTQCAGPAGNGERIAWTCAILLARLPGYPVLQSPEPPG